MGHEPTQDSACGEGHTSRQSSAFGVGHEPTQDSDFDAFPCLVARRYAEFCSPQYPRRRLGAQIMLPVPKSRRVQCLSESNVARLTYAIFIVNKTLSSVTVPPTNHEPCSDSERSGLTPEAIFKPSRVLVGQRARGIGQKLRQGRFGNARLWYRPSRGADEISWFLRS